MARQRLPMERLRMAEWDRHEFISPFNQRCTLTVAPSGTNLSLFVMNPRSRPRGIPTFLRLPAFQMKAAQRSPFGPLRMPTKWLG